jgi:fluoroquinolone transport system ATP-binding protein
MLADSTGYTPPAGTNPAAAVAREGLEARMIEVAHLTFTYAKRDAPAVRDISFAAADGEILGFLGPNGAGKSTTQKILTGLLRGYEGSVTLFGRSLADWHSDLYERIGVSFESPNHYLKLTARENLTYFARLYDRQTCTPDDLLQLVNLQDAADMPVGQFSKGMKSRLSIARALLNNPELIFMDEPTGGLDPVSARRVKDLIKDQRAKGRTIFLTTHDMTVADALCDRVAFIVDGQIRLIEPPRELKLRYGQPRVRVEYEHNGDLSQREFALRTLADDAGFATLLRQGGLRTIHSQEATLEEVFIQVTGRKLS